MTNTMRYASFMHKLSSLGNTVCCMDVNDDFCCVCACVCVLF